MSSSTVSNLKLAGLNLVFHHIGYATHSIDNELPYFLNLGYQKGKFFVDHKQNVSGVFLHQNNFTLELLEPLTNPSPLDSWLNRKIHMYHQAFTTSNFDSAISHFKNLNCALVSEPTKSVAFDGARICFFMQKNQLLFELIEKI